MKEFCNLCIMRILLTISLLIGMQGNLCAKEWIRFIDPSNIQLMVSGDKKPISIRRWKDSGVKNFVNLSFFGNNKIIGNLIIDSDEIGIHRKDWYLMCIFPYVGERRDDKQPRIAFSGSNLLVKNGKACEIPKRSFTKRKCPRTCIGSTKDGKIVIFVTTQSDLESAAKRMEEIGCDYAVNVDGGHSTTFMESEKVLWTKNRSIPVILSWE